MSKAEDVGAETYGDTCVVFTREHGTGRLICSTSVPEIELEDAPAGTVGSSWGPFHSVEVDEVAQIVREQLT